MLEEADLDRIQARFELSLERRMSDHKDTDHKEISEQIHGMKVEAAKRDVVVGAAGGILGFGASWVKSLFGGSQ